jgi:hypothetical protein
MEIDEAGRLVAGLPLFTIDRTTGAVLSQCPFNLNSFAIETVTGMFAGVHGSNTMQEIWWAPRCGAKTIISTPPPAGWGIPASIAVAHDPIAYGAPSPVIGPGYRFHLVPNAGGLPILGNQMFSLAVAHSNGGAAAGAWVIALGDQRPPLPLPFLCIDAHVDPARHVLSLPLAASPSLPAVLPLPIPSSPELARIRLFAQTVHLDTSCLAASDGVRVTILQ